MNQINRRNFIKNCGAGMGIIIASGIPQGRLYSAASGGGSGSIVTAHEFNVTHEEIRKLLESALSKGGEFAELFFEYNVSNTVAMEEDILKSSSQSIDSGVGIRVIKGDQTGYAYTNNLVFEEINKAALTAAAIASGPAKVKVADIANAKPYKIVYNLKNSITDLGLARKIELVKAAYIAAQNYDKRIIKIRSTLGDEMQHIMIANSEGLLISDIRPQVRLMVSATAEDKGVKNTGFGNHGGRVGLDFYEQTYTPKQIGERASKEALTLLTAVNAPAGEQIVVLGKNQSGVMIHEAVGHPLEADGNRKKTSIMWDKMGQMVANPIVTIYDDATIPDYRGSLSIDDEGVQTRNVLLIDKGKLVAYMNDRLSAKILKHEPNGHGRRMSYQHPAIPRMNNTVLAPGDHTPEEIISSVKKGFYADTYQGGMVSGTGKFTFSVNLGYLIEDGKITRPVKNATLIGTNVQILKEVDMIGNDMGFFLGTCGKDGQSVPVTAGTPTLRIAKMTVGGAA